MVENDIRIARRFIEGSPTIEVYALTNIFDRKLEAKVINCFSTGDDDVHTRYA